MKLKLIFCTFLLPIVFNAAAQSDTAALSLSNVSIVENTINGFSLKIDFKTGLDSMIIDDDYLLMDNASKPKFHMTYQGVASKGSCIEAHSYTSRSGFGVKVDKFTDKQIQLFLAKDVQIGVQCDKDFIVRYYPATVKRPTAADYHYFIVKADNLNDLITNSLTISDSDRSSYVTAINNFYYFENKVDVGVAPATPGTATSYVLSAAIRNKFAPAKIMSCNAGDGGNTGKPQLFWSLNTRLSTNTADSLNYISFSPINLAWYSRNFARQLDLKLSNESDETFTNKRAALDGSFQTIIPNFVNFTTPQDNRLRLKPIINIGAKGYYDYSNNMTAYTSGQGYAKLYYYIPVYNNYSFIINGTAFYDMSSQRNPGHRLSTNYSLVVASELPVTGFKAILKYENGKSDYDSKTGSTVIIGLMMDFLKDHKSLSNDVSKIQSKAAALKG